MVRGPAIPNISNQDQHSLQFTREMQYCMTIFLLKIVFPSSVTSLGPREAPLLQMFNTEELLQSLLMEHFIGPAASLPGPLHLDFAPVL